MNLNIKDTERKDKIDQQRQLLLNGSKSWIQMYPSHSVNNPYDPKEQEKVKQGARKTIYNWNTLLGLFYTWVPEDFYKEVIAEREVAIKERDARPDITLDVWNNDYFKRPTQAEFDKLKAELANSQKDATSWKSVYELEKDKAKGLENDKTQLTTELTNKNNEINTILTKWKAKDLTELSAGIQNTIDKRNELAKEVKSKDETISQKDKTINSLQLKNEKLTDSYKKLINYFADARKEIVHLQGDLFAEKLDKAHIQKELDDTLAILNKPTSEMGTQTDLTAEQITQMEQDLETKKEELAKLVQDQKQQSEEYQRKLQELSNLQVEYNTEVKPKRELAEETELIKHYFCHTLFINDNSYFTFYIKNIENIKKVLKLFKGYFQGNIVIWKGTNQNLDLTSLKEFVSSAGGFKYYFYFYDFNLGRIKIIVREHDWERKQEQTEYPSIVYSLGKKGGSLRRYQGAMDDMEGLANYFKMEVVYEKK